MAVMSTFHIIGYNITNGRYIITAKQEESNFFKEIVIPGKLKYVNKVRVGNEIVSLTIPPYSLGGRLIPESVETKGKVVKFDTGTSRCITGTPCYDDLIVSWVCIDNKLIATHYVDKYRGDWNEAQQKYESKEDRIKMSP